MGVVEINETEVVHELASIDHDDRIVIMLAACAFVLLFALIVVCKVCPGCCLREYCPLRAKYADDSDFKQDEKQRLAVAAGSSVVVPSLRPHPRPQAAARNGSLPKVTRPKAHTPTSGYGTADSSGRTRQPSVSPAGRPAGRLLAKTNSTTDSISNLSVSSGGSPLLKDSPFSFGPTEQAAPELDFALHYNLDDEQLAVYVKKARNVCLNLDGQTSDCWVRVVIVRDLKKGWVRKRPSSISMEDLTAPGATFDMVEVRTQTVRRSLNPVFDEYFAVDLKEKDRKYAIVKFICCHHDRRGRQYTSAQCHLSLGRVDLSRLQEFTKPMNLYRPELGALQVSLNYLPTAERLCVVVGQASRLRLHGQLCHTPTPINAMGKLQLVHKGKCTQKQQTATHFDSVHPNFNETFTFDLPQSEVERATLMITLVHQNISGQCMTRSQTQEEATSSTSSSVSSDAATPTATPADDSAAGSGSSVRSGHGRQRRKSDGNVHMRRSASTLALPANKTKARSSNNMPDQQQRAQVLGRLAFGAQVPGEPGAHWAIALHNPRAQHLQTHKLLP